MRSIKIMTLSMAFSFFHSIGLSQSNHLTSEEIKLVVGCWEGTLTYLDYSTNKPFSMPAGLSVKRIGATNSFSFANSYPNEPNANSIDTVSISPDGKSINNEVITSKRTLKNGTIEIISELFGEDGNDNKKAKFRFTYIIGADLYEHKKEVQFIATTQWILRHEYKYRTRPCS